MFNLHTNRPAQIVGILLLLALGWIALRDAAAQSLGRKAPQVVLRLDPDAPEAINQWVAVRVVRAPDEAKGKLRAMLTRSIAETPLNPTALRLLGASYGVTTRDPEGRKFFELAERTSRRDVGTQMYFIVESATRGDAVDAVTRIDRALRTSLPSRAQLFPVLGRVIQLPDGETTLARFIRKDTPWLSDFLSFAVDARVDPAAIARLVIQLDGFPDGRQRPVVEQMLFRMLEGRRDYRELAAIMPHMVTAPRGLTASVAIDEETLDPDWQPLSWQLSSSAGVVVNPIAAENGKDLVFNATLSGGISAEVARKLLLLQPGAYRLTVSQDLQGGDRGNKDVEARWQFACMDTAPAAAASPPAPAGGVASTPALPAPEGGAAVAAKQAASRPPLWAGTPTAKKFFVDLKVPANCGVQALSLRVRSPSDAADASMTAGPLSLRRID